MLIAAFGQYFFGITIFVSSLFLIMLVLVQRGRGGGLAGALGGPGGQSAFGTKAGDLFTRITIVVAAVWIFLCASAVFFLKAKKFTAPVTRTGPVSQMSGSSSPDGGIDLPPMDANPSGAAVPGLELQNSNLPGAGEIPDSNAEITELPEAPTNLPPVVESTPPESPPETPASEPTASETPGDETPASEPASSESPAEGSDETAETGELTLEPAAPQPAAEPPTGDQL